MENVEFKHSKEAKLTRKEHNFCQQTGSLVILPTINVGGWRSHGLSRLLVERSLDNFNKLFCAT
jgi:hypothetical protein